MGKIIASAILLMALVLTCCNSAQAGPRGKRNFSRGGRFSFQLESNGRTLSSFTHKGRTYVEGAYGNNYQIRVMNHTGERAEAVVSVDGRDVVSGQMGDYRKQRGYVIAPYSSVLIEGFRTSYAKVAQFSFTDVGDSYAARRGDASNVGVIGVAVFTEKKYRPRPQVIADNKNRRQNNRRTGTGYGEQEDSSTSRGRGDLSDGAAASGGSAKSAESAPSSDSDGYGRGARRPARREAPRQGIGTRYGNQKHSPAERTSFTRNRASRPDYVLAVRYDDRQGLIEKGVLPRPRPIYRRPVEKPNPFPNSPEPGFAPPPPPAYYYE